MGETSVAGSAGNAGGIIGAIALIAVLIGAAVAYNSFKYRGFRPRTVRTELSSDQLRLIFEQTVSGKGWTIVDDGNPIVAQSGLLAGIRQQIALTTAPVATGTNARIQVVRYSKKVLGGPTKAYTLRWRMSAFLAEVQRADLHATIAG